MARTVNVGQYRTKVDAIGSALAEKGIPGCRATYRFDPDAKTHSVRVTAPKSANFKTVKKAVRGQLPYRFALDTNEVTEEGRRATWTCVIPDTTAKVDIKEA